MTKSSTRAALVGHTVLAAMFALAGFWALRRGWALLESGEGGWQLAIPILAVLGSISLVLRELRALLAARRGANSVAPSR